MATRSEVFADIALLRQSLRNAGNPHLPLLQVDLWRPLRDTAFDLCVIALTLTMAIAEPLSLPFALLALGNRQRALGNILHDAAHRNLTRNRRLNDLVTRAVIAPLLFLSLSRYRDLHFRHHLDLGRAGGDPDLISIPKRKAASWTRALATNALRWPAFAGSAFGHLVDRAVSWPKRLYIVAWWAAVCALLVTAAGPTAISEAMAVWMLARVTAFHVIPPTAKCAITTG